MERGEFIEIVETVTDQPARLPDIQEVAGYGETGPTYEEVIDSYVDQRLPDMKAELMESAIKAAEKHEQWATITKRTHSETESKALHYLRTRLSGFFQEEGFQTQEHYAQHPGSWTHGLTIFWGQDAKARYASRSKVTISTLRRL